MVSVTHGSPSHLNSFGPTIGIDQISLADRLLQRSSPSRSKHHAIVYMQRWWPDFKISICISIA